VTTDYLGYTALKKTINLIQCLNDSFGKEIAITKIIPTMFDRRNKICKEYLDKLRNEYYDIIAEPIRVNSKVKEAPKYGKSIFAYDKKSKGAFDYFELVKSVVNDETSILIKEKSRTVESEPVHVGASKKVATAVAS
jgi:chromosome partitioning protein